MIPEPILYQFQSPQPQYPCKHLVLNLRESVGDNHCNIHVHLYVRVVDYLVGQEIRTIVKANIDIQYVSIYNSCCDVT